MDVTCNVIEDLLPLYADDICSEDSKTIVEHHTAVCSECKEKLSAMTKELEKNEETPKPENPFKKTRTHYVRLIVITLCICAVIAIPSVICSVLTANEVAHHGESWTTLKVKSRLKEIGRMIKNGEYREALDEMIIPNLEGYSESDASEFKDLFAEDMKNYFKKHPIEDFNVYANYHRASYRVDGYLHMVMKNESGIRENSSPVYELTFSTTDIKLGRCRFVYGTFDSFESNFWAVDKAVQFYNETEAGSDYDFGLPDMTIAPADFSEKYFIELDPDAFNKDNRSYDRTFFSYDLIVKNFKGDDQFYVLKDNAIKTTEKFMAEYSYFGCRNGNTEYIRDEVLYHIDRFVIQHATLLFLRGDELITVDCDVPYSLNAYPYRISAVRNIVYSDNTPDDFKEQFEAIFAC
ncbi:MAG: zf-HC2 domain-containing protein [Oscillospiraceae bacterium]|nr:zf-HC2 domain-containing protein [Oscillospiraceae bacterium]